MGEHTPQPAPRMESLLTPDVMAPAPRAAAPSGPTVEDALRGWWRTFRRAPSMKWPRRVASLAGVLSLALACVWAVVRLTPEQQPDYSNDDLGDVLEFTLLTDGFNKLPLDERMKLLKDLVTRMKSMSEDDAPIMAAFAASIKNEMRKQIELNVKKLAADMVDDYAKRYATVEPGDAPEFLDESIIEFTHLMEDIAGEKSPLPTKNDERLAAIKTQARKDEERFREDKSKMTAARAARFFEFIHDPDGQVADPIQRGRSAKFMRDMTRHLRGQDPSTGKPAKGPG